jgi:hypothetical protein
MLYSFWMCECKKHRAGRVPRNLNPVNERNANMKLTKAETSLIQFMRKSARKSSSPTMAADNRGNSIRAAIRSGRSKSAVRRQYRLTDYEYRGHKATVTRELGSY